MTIDFTCQKCEASFEIVAQDLIDGTEKLVCPHCDAKAAANVVDDFSAALTEIRAQVAALSKKFAVNLSVETEELEDELEDDVKDKDEVDDDEDLDLEDDDDDVDDDEDVEDEDMDES
jgi:DNA-directed RNA polymerase subunit RPC12/RpoP